MQFLRLLALVGAVATSAASPQWEDPYPAPCGRSIPSGRCMTEAKCAEIGGFYSQRDCPFYDVGDIGCCFQT